MNYIIKQIAHINDIPANVILEDKSKTAPKGETYINPPYVEIGSPSSYAIYWKQKESLHNKHV